MEEETKRFFSTPQNEHEPSLTQVGKGVLALGYADVTKVPALIHVEMQTAPNTFNPEGNHTAQVYILVKRHMKCQSGRRRKTKFRINANLP